MRNDILKKVSLVENLLIEILEKAQEQLDKLPFLDDDGNLEDQWQEFILEMEEIQDKFSLIQFPDQE